MLDRMVIAILITEEIETRALNLQSRGFRALDALHLASAESGEVDFFCTCDDRFLSRIRQMTDCKIRVVSPIELLQEIVS